MRQYCIFTAQRYIGETGKKLRRGISSRAKGDPERELYKDAQILADVLVNNPNANQYGLYYIVPRVMSEMCGLDDGEIAAALKVLDTERFASYDDATEYVWVREMARVQMWLPLKPGDRNVVLARKWYSQLQRNPFLGPFYDRYAVDLHLEERRDEWAGREQVLPLETSAGEPISEEPTLFQRWFLIFLEEYPAARRVGGTAGEEAFRRAMQGKGEDHLNLMLDALFYQKRSQQWREGVIPGMVKWLAEQQWMRDLRMDKNVALVNGGRLEMDCAHGCTGAGQHALRVQLEKVCRHTPACTTFLEHHNYTGEEIL